MKNISILLVWLVLSSVIFSLEVYPINENDLSSGCFDYVQQENPLVGNPDSNQGALSIFNYKFDFYLPQVNANSEDLRLMFQRKGGFDTLVSCSGSPSVLANLNQRRAGVSFIDKNLAIHPDAPLKSGFNSISFTNTSEKTFCTGGSCPGALKSGLCMFRLCGFYPTLTLSTDAPPSEVYSDENFTLPIQVINKNDVDAGNVKIEILDTDFSISPGVVNQVILSQTKAPFNKIEYKITFKPKIYVELDTGSSSTPKRIGTLSATYTDVNGKKRAYQKNLGSIAVLKTPETQANPAVEPTISSPENPPPEPQAPKNPSPCGLPIGILCLSIFLKSGKFVV